MAPTILPPGKVRLKRQDEIDVELHVSDVSMFAEIVDQADVNFRSHVPRGLSFGISLLSLISPVTFRYSETYHTELLREEDSSLNAKVKEYERMST
jgi:hypothetical protein